MYNDDYKEIKIDATELWRENYLDALDEIRELRWRIKELEIENKLLQKDIERAENHIINFEK